MFHFLSITWVVQIHRIRSILTEGSGYFLYARESPIEAALKNAGYRCFPDVLSAEEAQRTIYQLMQSCEHLLIKIDNLLK
jgi:hypothetical protein